ncbi:MAG: hypothetical protein AAGB93_23290 [Planctomycetota bacterium]
MSATDGESEAAADAAVRRRFRRTSTARTHMFAALATLALVGPGSLGLDWTPWRGVDGGVVAVALLSLVAHSLPPIHVAARVAAPQTLVLAAGAVGGTAPFLVLAAATGGPPDRAVLGLVGFSVLLAGAVLAGRRGGLLPAVAVLAVCAAAVLAPGPLPAPSTDGGAGGASSPAGERELVPVRVDLRGPLRAAVVSADAGAPLRIEADLGPGETRSSRAWIAAPVDRVAFGVEIVVEALDPPEVDGAGAAERVRVALDEARSPRDPVRDALTARARPALREPARRAPLFEALLVAWVAMVLVTSLGGRLGPSRPALAAFAGLAAGGLGAAGAWALDRTVPLGESPRVSVHEGQVSDAGEARWIRVDRAAGAQEWGTAGKARADRVSVPDGAVVEVRLFCGRPEDAGSGADDRVRVTASGGAHVDVVRGTESGLRGLRREVNTWGDLEAAWRRAPDGTWTAHGPWALGEPLPAEREGAGPPGWALLGLAPGVEAFVGRAAGSPQGASLAGGAAEGWVRVTRR